MRILVVSNVYPPYHVGGYELACAQTVDSLRRRGHEVVVLTSTHGVGEPVVDGDVLRLLSYRPFDWHRRPRLRRSLRLPLIELRNRRAFRRVVESVRPDVVQFWNVRQLSLSLIDQAERLGIPVALYVHDSWLAQLPLVDPWYRLVRRVRGGGEPRFRHVQFASAYLRDRAIEAGRRMDHAEAVPWGVDTVAFPFRVESRPFERLLYVGQIEEHKGVDVAIEALALAREDGAAITLTIVGGTGDEDYAGRLRALVSSLGLEPHVDFRGRVPHEDLAPLYRAHDVLLFPSRSPNEGLPLTLLEAMSSGLPVVGTAASGATDVLRDGDNALTFPMGDARACASLVGVLAREPELVERLRKEARRRVEAGFELERTVDAIEQGLVRLGGAR